MKRWKTISLLPAWRSTTSVKAEDRHAATIDLARQSCLAVAHPTGISIFCRSGLLWITRVGSLDDTVLNAGQSFEIAGRHDVLIHALHASCFEIRHTRSAT